MAITPTHTRVSLEVEATEWLEPGDHPQVKTFAQARAKGAPVLGLLASPRIFGFVNKLALGGWLKTASGWKQVRPSDMVIEGPEGVFDVMSAAKFADEFEVIDP